MANSKPDDKKTMDVSKPGDSAPDITSRPVLVTRRPMIQDPMVTPEKSTASTTPSPEKPTSHVDKTIQPLKPEEPEVAVETSKEAETLETEAVEAKPSEPVKEDDPAENSEDAGNDEAVVDAVAAQADVSSKRKEQQLSEAEKAKQDALEKLITDKKYFVPIGQVSRRRNSRRALVALLLIVLLAVAAAYLLVDAGFIKSNITLPVDLIKN